MIVIVSLIPWVIVISMKRQKAEIYRYALFVRVWGEGVLLYDG